jgi:hypothetical protein
MIPEPPGLREDIQPCHGDKRSIQAQQVGQEPEGLAISGGHDGRKIPERSAERKPDSVALKP